MYSFNQVNKLVSCGRDPARSLPFWRGFLLIPLILVCFAVAPQTRAVSPPPDGDYPGLNTAEGHQALFTLIAGFGNSAFGWRALFSNGNANFNTGAGVGALVLNQADENTGVGAASILLNVHGRRNTAVGAATLVNNAGDTSDNGAFNGAVGAFALNGNVTGFSNNAMGDSALFSNINAAENTAVGDEALEVNDSTGHGMGNFNTAVGALSLLNNVDGSSNTAVGNGSGPNVANGFGNTYAGDSVGTLASDESNTIRIGDLSNGNGSGSLECYIGGIFNNPQPIGGTVVAVTLDLSNDHLGFDPAAGRPGNPASAPHRSAPQPRMRPNPSQAHQAMLNDKVEKLEARVAQQQATVEQQQKQIETLTTQLRDQAAQIQKVSAEVELIKPTPRVVENR